MAIQQFDRRYRMREFYEKTGLRWADVKAGFELREKRYGLSNADWNLLLYFACAALDRATGRRAAEHIGDDWQSSLLIKTGFSDLHSLIVGSENITEVTSSGRQVQRHR